MADAGPGLGTMYGGLALHDISATACELQGSPQIELLDARGVVRQSSSAPDASFSPKAVVLVSNSWARTEGAWPIGPTCAGTGNTTTVRVSLPGQAASRDVRWVAGTQEAVDCPPSISYRPRLHQLGVGPFWAIPTEPDNTGDLGAVAALAPSLHVPLTVRRGAVLRYQLLLTASGVNGGGVDDQVCPLYDVGVAGFRATYELRCDETINLTAGQAVAYDLQVQVPADAPLGATTLRFQFLEPQLALLTVPVTVVR